MIAHATLEHAAQETRRFRDWIMRRLGLYFDDAKFEVLVEILKRHAAKSDLSLPLYLERLEGSDSEREVQALIPELTVSETYFFRHIEQLRAFAEVALPEALSAGAPSRRLQILSVGCASGEEPYTLAMIVRECGADVGGNIAIRGIDINPAMLAKAMCGRYSSWALREAPVESQRRWFRSIGNDFMLEDSIRNAVTFKQVNLACENAELWIPGTYDVIFCRNVLMYFSLDVARAVVERLTRSLAPGGHLFLGHAETLRGLSNDYQLCHTHGTFYYRRKNLQCEAPQEKSRDKNDDFNPHESTPHVVVQAPAHFPETAWTTPWLETIQHASIRIQAIAERPLMDSTPKKKNGLDIVKRAATHLQPVLELLSQERFSDALDLLGCLPSGSEKDLDVLLLRAALLTHSGQLSAAERANAELLDRDELNAGAHYLLALCRENIGDRQGALDHNKAAVYLDPGFAMPRLHLGLMARREGDTECARRELEHALLLLQREDADRLQLFGGGFERSALVALCRAELLSAGGKLE